VSQDGSARGVILKGGGLGSWRDASPQLVEKSDAASTGLVVGGTMGGVKNNTFTLTALGIEIMVLLDRCRLSENCATP